VALHYTIKATTKFHAAHRLTTGKCAKLHGHTWHVTVFVTTDSLESDMVIDVNILKSLLDKATKDFDHAYLNEHPAFMGYMPTMERIAEIIYKRLKKEIRGDLSILVDEGGEGEVVVW